MDYFSPHLASLRQEITDLRNINVLYARQSVHSTVEEAASRVRASRLLQIKQELSNMRDYSPEPKVWWDKVRKPTRGAQVIVELSESTIYGDNTLDLFESIDVACHIVRARHEA